MLLGTQLPPYTRIVYSPKPSRRYIFLGPIALFLSALLLPASAATATGRFEVYCDGVGIFLAKIDGAPAPGKLVLFSYMSGSLGTIGGSYFGQGRWSDAFVYRDGCVPDGKCESIARGKVWIDASDASNTGDLQPKRISGKYEIDLNGKHLQGGFVAKEHSRKHPLRFCM